MPAPSARGRLSGSALVVLAAALPGCAAPPATRPAAGWPVSWERWGPDPFARARERGDLVLVDVVAEWCHWCHVMDERTYRDRRVVDLLSSFVTVRADADACPDAAERYARWAFPATAVHSPDGTLVAARRGYQEPDAFVAWLSGLLAAHRAGTLAPEPAIEALPPARAGRDPLSDVRARTRAQLDATYDAARHGWGTPQKYPLAAPLEHALLRARLGDGPGWRERALATLEAQRALLDPVWGGMYQYSDDGTWSSPHREKIVAVQAGALEAFALAYRATGDPRWLAAANDVLRYAEAFLLAPDGAFYTAQDADPPPGAGLTSAQYFALGDAERRARGVPRVDTNVYAEPNGLLIQALCRLHEASLGAPESDPRPLELARRAARRILETHRMDVYVHPPNFTGASLVGDTYPEPRAVGFTHADQGTDRNSGRVHLADNVAMGRAALCLHEATGDPSWLWVGQKVAARLQGLEDRDRGGFLTTEAGRASAIGLLAERRLPLGENARAARFLLRLSWVTGEASYRERAERALRAVSDPAFVASHGRLVGDYLLALEELELTPVTLTIVARPGEGEALHRAALLFDAPARVVKTVAPGGEYPDAGRPTLYLCGGGVCSAPIDDPARVAPEAEAFVARLRSPGAPEAR